MQDEADAPPAKRTRKSAAPKPRAKKTKSIAASEEPTNEEHPSTSAETSKAPPPKRRVRPQPGMLKKGMNMFGDVEKSSEPGGSGSGPAGKAGMAGAQPAEGGGDQRNLPNELPDDRREDEMQLDDTIPAEQVKQRRPPSVKARGKQKATVEEHTTDDPTEVEQQAEPDTSVPTPTDTAQKKRPGRKAKAKTTKKVSTTETAVDPSLTSHGEGAEVDTSTSAPMEVDELEPSNRRRSARLKGTKK